MIVRNLPIFANDLKIGLQEITSAFQSLGNTWQDEEYERFKKCLVPLRATVEEMTHELSLQERNMEIDLENLIRLQQIKQ